MPLNELRKSGYWASAILIGTVLNLLLFVVLPKLGRSEVPPPPEPIIVELSEWQVPQPPQPKPVLKPKEKPKPKPKPKQVVKPKPQEQPKPEPLPEPTPEPVLTDREIDPPEQVVEKRPEPIAEPVEEVLPTPVHISKLTSLPRHAHRAFPIYPPAMEAQGIEAVVRLKVLIDIKGNVKQVTVVKSAGAEFDKAAVDAAWKSTFIPAKANGQSVPAIMTFPIRFQIR
ncbi:MAG: energy transducer TonB [Gammaproteobacteria bacterium]|nr:energy transducer TonB [Gammaproteobacteria bacterium]MDH5729298.1 energy transducer TonB [Gammaproteobacteria bacterium]